MRKLKVIQLVPELNSGGVERGTLELGKYLSLQGHESVVISNGGRMVDQLIRDGSQHIQMPVHRKNPVSLLQVLKLRKLFLHEKPDIVHARSRVPAWLAFIALKLISNSQRPKFVTTVHGFYSVNAYSKIMTRGDHVICVSNSVKDYVLKNYPEISKEKISIIYRGLKSSNFNFGYRPNKEWLHEWNKDFPQIRNAKLLVLPGRITRLKGHIDFFKILKELGSGYCGIIVGNVHEKKVAYIDELKSSAELMGISDRIIFLGHRDDLKNIFSISYFVLSLSVQPESFGRTVLEALAIGVPVIGYDIGGVGEILDKLLPEGKVPARDITAAVERIKCFKRNQLRPIPNHAFKLEEMLSKTLRVYTELSFSYK